MNPTEVFEAELMPLMKKYGFILKNGIFIKFTGNIAMAFSCPSTSFSDILCSVFPIFEASRLGITGEEYDLISNKSWIGETLLSNRPSFSDSISAKIEGECAEAQEPEDFSLGKIRMGVFVLPELMNIKDFVSYTDWRSGEYKMSETHLSENELLYRSHLDGNFDYARRCLLRFSRNSCGNSDPLSEKYAMLYSAIEKNDASFIEDFVQRETERFLPVFMNAFPEAFQENPHPSRKHFHTSKKS